MLKTRSAIVLAAAALIALIFTGCYRTPEQRAERFVNHMASELNLDDAQKVKLEKIKDEFLARRPEMKKIREETVSGANELMRSAEIDKAKLDALIEKNRTEANDMIGFIAAKFAEIHDMLTPVQREKLVEHIEKFMKHRRGKDEPAKAASTGTGSGY